MEAVRVPPVPLVTICAAVAVAFTISRWSPEWIRGTAMLVVGFVGLAITGGVVAKRVAASIGIREASASSSRWRASPYW